MARVSTRDLESKYDAGEPLTMLTAYDVIGLDPVRCKLWKQYADVDGVIRDAVESDVREVEGGDFPTSENVYEPLDE